MGLISKTMTYFSQMAEKFAPSPTPFERLVREKKEKGGLYKEIAKIIIMMGGGAVTGSILAVVGLVLIVLLVPFILLQIFFFPIAAPLTILFLSLIIGIVSEME